MLSSKVFACSSHCAQQGTQVSNLVYHNQSHEPRFAIRLQKAAAQTHASPFCPVQAQRSDKPIPRLLRLVASRRSQRQRLDSLASRAHASFVLVAALLATVAGLRCSCGSSCSCLCSQDASCVSPRCAVQGVAERFKTTGTVHATCAHVCVPAPQPNNSFVH